MGRRLEIPRSYTECAKFMQDETVKIVCNNTFLYQYTESSGEIWFALRYYKTILVRYYYDGSVELSRGDYSSLSTKRRINSIINRLSPQEYGGNVFQHKFYWFIEEIFPNNMKREIPAVPFTNGFMLYIGDLDETTGYRLRNPSR